MSMFRSLLMSKCGGGGGAVWNSYAESIGVLSQVQSIVNEYPHLNYYISSWEDDGKYPLVHCLSDYNERVIICTKQCPIGGVGVNIGSFYFPNLTFDITAPYCGTHRSTDGQDVVQTRCAVVLENTKFNRGFSYISWMFGEKQIFMGGGYGGIKGTYDIIGMKKIFTTSTDSHILYVEGEVLVNSVTPPNRSADIYLFGAPNIEYWGGSSLLFDNARFNDGVRKIWVVPYVSDDVVCLLDVYSGDIYNYSNMSWFYINKI